MSTQDPYTKYGGSIATDPYAKYGGAVAGITTPTPATDKPETSWLDSAIQFGKSYLSSANPVPVDLLKSIYQRGNIETLKGIGQVQADQFTKAKDAFSRGNYADAGRYTLGWLIPLIGPAANAAGDKLREGKYAEGAGETLGLATQIALPEAVGRVAALNTGPLVKSRLNPTEQAAVAFGDREGIPVDMATRTGNKVIRNTQGLVQNQIGGAAPAQAARAAQAEALTATGERLKNRVEPNLGVRDYTPETAGQSVKDSLRQRIQRFDRKADEAYSDLRRIENANIQPVQVGTQQQPIIQGVTHMGYQTVPVTKGIGLPVDMRPTKAALTTTYERLKQTMPLAQQQASKGFQAIGNIISGDDFVSASTADANLSSIKSIAREAESPELRNVSQGLAAKAATELDQAVRTAVAQGGPDALRALQRGRALTKAKYGAADLLNDLREEPVQVFNQLTFRKDSSVDLLRDVAKQAPQDLPKLGRAFLDGLFDTATKEGGFGKSGTIFNQWANLGNETKRLLFRNPALIQDLDNFFLLAKRVSENPNPSGTAYVATILPTVGLVVTAPQYGVPLVIGNSALSRMLFNPSASRALMKGFKIPLGSRAAAALAASEILKQAGTDAQPLGTPAQ